MLAEAGRAGAGLIRCKCKHQTAWFVSQLVWRCADATGRETNPPATHPPTPTIHPTPGPSISNPTPVIYPHPHPSHQPPCPHPHSPPSPPPKASSAARVLCAQLPPPPSTLTPTHPPPCPPHRTIPPYSPPTPTSKGKLHCRGAVCTNWPSRVGSCVCFENTGASVVSPLGLQKPLVVQSVRGHGISSSFKRAKIFLYLIFL